MAAPFDIKLTNTYFSSNFSNQNADNAGFQLDIGYTYADLMKMIPEFNLSNVQANKLTMKTLLFD